MYLSCRDVCHVSCKIFIWNKTVNRGPVALCYVRYSLRWRHNDHAGVSNHQSRDRLLNRLFRRRSKKTSKLRVTGLCAGNSPGTGEFPAQMASNAENVSIWWRHHVFSILGLRNDLLPNWCQTIVWTSAEVFEIIHWQFRNLIYS